ncbi:hypothetical protein EW145_g1662 [Phellinidium pouzarii]|uniref:Deacetylase sirtuin-type domain-containing protein n=1 Tax=Phellinidium pouzarii TaxID=167371 RepID=A0A4V3XDJ0_9AGAM|nr:hypothetical protein EW145_g1662 [Phellinidium pouzarii]
MRISVPTIPQSFPASASTVPPPSKASAVERIASFLAPGNVTVLSGAGVSVDSGIRAYRGKDGRYMNPNYKLRSFLGYPPVRDALPNTTHFAIAALQYTSQVSRLITQNVDGLHNKAISSVWTPSEMSARILELHGTLHVRSFSSITNLMYVDYISVVIKKVSCKHGHVVDRNLFQEWLAKANPYWSDFVDNLERTGQKLRTNPDGDVVIEGASYDDFVVPDCPSCLYEHRSNNVHKPHLIFFGESITKEVKERSFQDVEFADRLFIIGTTLATFSAFRLLKHALELKKPVLMLNLGPTRADTLALGVEKIELSSGLVLQDVVRTLAGRQMIEDPVLAKLLSNGIVKPPVDDDDDDIRTPETSK